MKPAPHLSSAQTRVCVASMRPPAPADAALTSAWNISPISTSVWKARAGANGCIVRRRLTSQKFRFDYVKHLPGAAPSPASVASALHCKLQPMVKRAAHRTTRLPSAREARRREIAKASAVPSGNCGCTAAP